VGYGALRVIRNLTAIGLISTAPAYAETLTIAALGDSLTQGYGLLPEEGFVPQLQAWLIAAGADVTVINAGVSGDTTAGGLARVAWTLTPDVDAMIVTLGGNDFLRGIDPAISRANLRGILEAAAETGVPVLLAGIEASGNYGVEFKNNFNAMYPELAAEFDALLYPSFFEALTEGSDLEQARATFMQPDGIHPNAAGVTLIVEGIGPFVLNLLEQAEAG
jgi:acyl-CoA thioesterase I